MWTFLLHVSPSQFPADDRVQSQEILPLPCPAHESGSLQPYKCYILNNSAIHSIHTQAEKQELSLMPTRAGHHVIIASILQKAENVWSLGEILVDAHPDTAKRRV